MTEKIRTRTFEYGNEKESSWPPTYGTSNGKGFSGYWDAETQSFKEGYPPPRVQPLGQAPMYFSDVMEAQRHPKTGEVVESRSRWQAIDKATGCVTTGVNESPSIKRRKNQREEDARWIHDIKKAAAMIDAGTAPLSERTREMCKRQNELVSSTTGLDASNVLGRKNATRKR
jgi:hypothetical protein